jgi:hypothetical protein
LFILSGPVDMKSSGFVPVDLQARKGCQSWRAFSLSQIVAAHFALSWRLLLLSPFWEIPLRFKLPPHPSPE